MLLSLVTFQNLLSEIISDKLSLSLNFFCIYRLSLSFNSNLSYRAHHCVCVSQWP